MTFCVYLKQSIYFRVLKIFLFADKILSLLYVYKFSVTGSKCADMTLQVPMIVNFT